MDLDLDTFLVTVYCTLDELYVAHCAARKPGRPGARPTMSDSEVLTLMVLAQWRADRSERAMLAYARKHWDTYFPRLLDQSAFNRRVHDLTSVLGTLGPLLAQRVIAAWEQDGGRVGYEAVDGVPVPLARRCRGLRRKLFAATDAGLGKGGSDKEWYFGVHLVAGVHACGALTGFVQAPADTAERWLADAFFRWRADPTAPQPSAAQLAPILGPRHTTGGQRTGLTGLIRGRPAVGTPATDVYVVDLGFAGARWQAHWHDHYGATVLTKRDLPAAATPPEQHALARVACGARQIVETAFGWLTAQLGLEFPRARTIQGVLARLSAKVVAYNLALWLNRLVGRPPLAHCNPFAL
jgi:hypothetical protein